MASFTFFPTLDSIGDDVWDKVGIDEPDVRFFTEEIPEGGSSEEKEGIASEETTGDVPSGRRVPLSASSATMPGCECKLSSQDGSQYQWTPDDNNLIIDVSVTVHRFGQLYGVNGLAPEGAELGFALMWANYKGTELRGCCPFEEPTTDENGTHFRCSAKFDAGRLSKMLNLSIVLYLKLPSPDVPREQLFLNNDSGVKLGSIWNHVYQLDEDTAQFPIRREAMGVDKPLWELEMQWEDGSDEFSDENVCLYINTDHRDYPKPDNGKSFNKFCSSPVLAQILAQSYFLILRKLIKDDGDAINRLNSADSEVDGFSIYGVVREFLHGGPKTFQVNADQDDAELLEAIQKRVYQRLFTQASEENGEA